MLKKESLTRKKFNNLKKYYDKTWDPQSHTLHVGIFNSPKNTLSAAYQNATDYLISKINKLSAINKDSVVLDVGCGTGRTIIEICSKYNCQGVGIDISDEQIKDAKDYLADLNKISKNKIKCEFIRGSASEIDAYIKGMEKFSHIISQDALLLVINKKRCLNGLYKLLKHDGALAIADFLSESTIDDKNENRLVKKFVNWDKSLSFNDYIHILNGINFQVIHQEQRNTDMIKTYKLLAKKIKPLIKSENTYQDLYDRYNGIVKTIKNGQMGWGIFVAQKIRKQALIAGTRQKSIGRFVAKYLHKIGWEIWLYGRHAKRMDRDNWHERQCDISDEIKVKKLLVEIPKFDLVLNLADTTDGHKPLDELLEKEIKEKFSAKLIGSLLLLKNILKKKQNKLIKFIWCAGSVKIKPKHLFLYTPINSGLLGMINELNYHYKDALKAYYLSTPLIRSTTCGDSYIKKHGGKRQAKTKSYVLNGIMKIINDKKKPGWVAVDEKTLWTESYLRNTN